MTIHLHIERLVLHDVPADGVALRAAVQRELETALAGSALHTWDGPGLALPYLHAGSPATGSPAGIAGAIAGAVGGLSGGDR